MTDIAAMRKYVQSARRSLPAAALPFATNLIEQFKFYEKVDDEHREGMKPLVERKTDISIFTKMLTPAKARALVSLQDRGGK